MPAWEALTARRARRRRARSAAPRSSGRERELTLLRETFARVTREREPQLLTLVGVPGIGKSRLVFELFQTIETGDFGLVFWRHGRSLPYGEGVTFWALGEMVKAQAGILETDDAARHAGEARARRSDAFVAQTDDAAWVERHLRPLAGLEADERGRATGAARRSLRGAASSRRSPTRGRSCSSFEDLHWADDALLDFVDYLVDWASGVPILVLCTARPELLARRSAGEAARSTRRRSCSRRSRRTRRRTLVHVAPRQLGASA